MKLFLLLMLWVNAVRIHGEEAFTCDNTGEECPSKMCFYGIDHEHSCYRAGCATEKQCAGRRHNECFIADGLHICCCMERGCAARYKGLSDCVDEPKNSTDTDEVTTPLASEAVEEQTTIKVLTTSTESQVESTSTEEAESQKAEPTPVSEEEEDYRDEESAEETTTGVPPQEEHVEEGEEEKEEETTTVAKRDTTSPALVVTTQQKETPTSTEAMKTTTTAERTTTTAERTTTSSTTSTSTQTSTTTSKRTTTTTSRATSPETTATRTTTSYVPRTTRYTTTQAPTPTTTTAHVEQLRALPDMPHIPLREDPEEDSEEMRNMERKPQTTSRRTTTTTSMRTTTRATTTPVRIVPPMRKTPVNEPNRELEPSRAEKSQFISPAVKSEGAVPDPSDEETTTQEDPDTKPTTSLINVYEVTTLAVKNKEVHEQWKAPVPWWAAVAVGFLVSVIVAWAVVFYLRKKKLREAEAANRRSAEKEPAVATPLLKPAEVPEH